MTENTNVFQTSLKLLKEKAHHIEVNAGTIITILKISMEVVELTKVKGPAQKDLAIKLVRHLVVEAPIADEKEKLLLDMIDNGILENTVELVVDASKGNIDINVAVKVASTCCASIFKKRN